jgi:uncharacterized protein HemX
MASPYARAAAADLARVALVLSPQRARRGWIAWCLLVVLAALAGAGASTWVWRERLEDSQRHSVAAAEVQQIQQRLDQARLQQRVSEGRSKELERQIDALNQRLHDAEDQLTFFRKARETRH